MSRLQALAAAPRRILVALGVLVLAGVVAAVAFAAPSPRGTAAEPAGKIYWVEDGQAIRRANLDGSEVEDVITGLHSPQEIALDVTARKIYWTDGADGVIRRANLDGGGVEAVLTGLEGPVGIEIDPGGGKVYWTELVAGKIRRADLDGGNVEDLVTYTLEEMENWIAPDVIALDRAGGRMYWNRGGAIERANLDGSDRMVVRQFDLLHCCPIGIAVDATDGKVLWTYVEVIAGHNSIERRGHVVRANLDGGGRETIADAYDVHGVAVDAGAGRLYWAEGTYDHPYVGLLGENGIRRGNLDGSEAEDVVMLEGRVGDVALDVPLSPPPPTPTPTLTRTPAATPTATPQPIGGFGGLSDPEGGGVAVVVAPNTGAGGTAGATPGPLVWGLVASALGLGGVALARWRLARRRQR